MNKSETIAKLSTSLALAQGEIENATKNSLNPHFKNKYADLSEVLNTIRPVFSKHGLAIVQLPSYEIGVASVETVLTHNSGEWISGLASCKLTKDDAQGYGSCLTYLRRYSLAAVCGIAQEDDDGQTAVKKPATPIRLALNANDYADLLHKLRDSSMLGSSSLESTFKNIPNSPLKKQVWAENAKSLKEVADQIDVGVTA